jgi:dTDP-4-dehydrorhamnose reductase
MKRLLITGGSGFVGGHVMSQAKGKWDVFASYHTHPFTYTGVTPLPLNLGEERSIEAVVERIQPEVIIHTAVHGDIDICERHPEKAFHINATSTEIIAELCARMDCRLIYVSTDMVFDGEKGDYSETDDARPINVYGKTKLAAEKFVKSVCPNHVIARSALIYGPPVTGSNSFSERMINVLKSGGMMKLFTDQYRTPILVQNLAQALLELSELSFTGTIHLGGADRIDRFLFGKRLVDIKRLPADKITPAKMSDVRLDGPRPRDLSLNTRKAKGLIQTKLLGYYEGLKQA